MKAVACHTGLPGIAGGNVMGLLWAVNVAGDAWVEAGKQPGEGGCARAEPHFT